MARWLVWRRRLVVVVRDRLEGLVAVWRAGAAPPLVYDGPADFVLREGRPMVPFALAADAPAGLPRRCFHNSIMVAAVSGLPYVEGFALNAGGPDPFAHAWNLDSRGRVVDTTWDERHPIRLPDGRVVTVPLEGRAYYGVEFSVWRAHDASWYGDSCVLDDWRRGWPIFQQAWVPEPSPGDRAERERTLRDILDCFNREGRDGRFPIGWDTFRERCDRTFGTAAVAG